MVDTGMDDEYGCRKNEVTVIVHETRSYSTPNGKTQLDTRPIVFSGPRPVSVANTCESVTLLERTKVKPPIHPTSLRM